MDDFVIIPFMTRFSLDPVSIRQWDDPGQTMSFFNKPWTSVIIVRAQVLTSGVKFKCLKLSGKYKTEPKEERGTLMTWRAHVLSSGAVNSQLPGTVSQGDVRSSDLSKEPT